MGDLIVPPSGAFGSNSITSTGTISLGINPAVGAYVNVPNNTFGMGARNAANSGDVYVFQVDNGNGLYIGTLTGTINTNVWFGTTGSYNFRDGSGNTKFSIAPATAVTFSIPIAWSAMVPNAGLFALAMTDANQTLTNVQYNNQVLRFTGTLTAQRNIVMPLVSGAAVLVHNATTGGFGLQVIGATGTGVVVAAGAKVWCFSDGTNWY